MKSVKKEAVRASHRRQRDTSSTLEILSFMLKKETFFTTKNVLSIYVGDHLFTGSILRVSQQ